MDIYLKIAQLLAKGLPVLIILSSVFLALSPLLVEHPKLVLGITLDLTLTAPLVYFFLIRKKRIPNNTVVPLFLAGVALASFLLPEHQRSYLNMVKIVLLPLVELGFVSVILFSVFRTAGAFRSNANQAGDFYLNLKEGAVQVVGYPKIAKVFCSEIAMIYYALFAWKRSRKPAAGFTNYKESAITAVYGGLIFIILVEAFVFHVLCVRWNVTIAWISTASSVYAALQLLGHSKAIRRRFSVIEGDTLYLKYGLFGDTELPLQDIEAVEPTTESGDDKSRTVVKLALLKKVESHNIVILLKKKHRLETAYGLSRMYDTILLHIDQKEDFLQRLNQALQPK